MKKEPQMKSEKEPRLKPEMELRGKSRKKGWGMGAGIAVGIAGALVAGYLVYEKTKPQHAKMKAWIRQARREAALQFKKLKNVTAEDYERLVAKAIEHYGKLQKASAPEIIQAISDAKEEWDRIRGQMSEMGSGGKGSKSKRKSAPRKKAPKKSAEEK